MNTENAMEHQKTAATVGRLKRLVIRFFKKFGRWQNSEKRPRIAGWYECVAIDDRWNGEMRYRAWGAGTWWIPLKDGWLTSKVGLYRWRGPVADVHGPAPDGSDPGRE